MRFIRVIFATILVVVGIAFIIENLEELTHGVQLKLDLYFAAWQSPSVHLWILILFSFCLGVLTASLYGIYEIIVQRQTIRQLRHNLEVLGQEIKRAGTVPEAKVPSPEPVAAPQSE